jgi:DNA adenine methylase
VVLVELDEDVASVWQTILNGDGEWLAQAILDFDFSRENIERAIEFCSHSTRDRAFATILRNRVNRGGILAHGAGRMKRGENGKGLSSRWYPETLSRG